MRPPRRVPFAPHVEALLRALDYDPADAVLAPSTSRWGSMMGWRILLKGWFFGWCRTQKECLANADSAVLTELRERVENQRAYAEKLRKEAAPLLTMAAEEEKGAAELDSLLAAHPAPPPPVTKAARKPRRGPA